MGKLGKLECRNRPGATCLIFGLFVELEPLKGLEVMKGGGCLIHPSIQSTDRKLQSSGVNCTEIDLMRICRKGRAPCERSVMKHLGFSCSAQKHVYSTITCSTDA